MNVFEYNDYKKCVNSWISSLPKEGHGILRRMSEALEVNSVVMSQVFRGTRDITLDQALKVTEFIGLSEIERDFFLLLVQRERAESYKLKTVLQGQIDKLRDSAQALKNRISHQKFSDENKAIFYSKWYYSAIRLGVSISKLNSAASIAQHLNLDRALVVKVLEFLLKNNLIVEQKGKLNIGPQVTHVGHDSPFVTKHHSNWRIKGLQAMEKSYQDDLFYTGPMALSEDAAKEIRKYLIDIIAKSTKTAANSESQTLKCLSIDWFGIKD